MIKSICLNSDYCNSKESAQLFHKTYNLGRKDPASTDDQAAKKPSHSTLDTYLIMTGIIQ